MEEIFSSIIEFTGSSGLQSIFDEAKNPCPTEIGTLDPGRHRLYTPYCLVYYCEEFNSTNSKLYEIP